MSMRTVSIPGIPFELPALGFGCSRLTGTSRRTALRLLETAFDNGVRHFDTARYYGYGESERLLGLFARSRRAQITITSKFGIQPPSQTSPLRLLLSVGRRFVRMVPAARKVAQSSANKLLAAPSPFAADECRKSLETSLRELGTDYLDFFLLHDYVVTGAEHEELLAFLESAVRSGKIRFFGIGTGIVQVLHALQSQPEFCRMVQFENSAVVRNFRDFDTAVTELVITHGSLGNSFQKLHSSLVSNRGLARSWSQKLGLDCSNGETLATLMLNYAVFANSKGLVLFSSTSVSRTEKNVRSIFQNGFSDEQLAVFGKLTEQIQIEEHAEA